MSKHMDMSTSLFLRPFTLLKETQNNAAKASKGGIGPLGWAMDMQAWTMGFEKPIEIVVYIVSFVELGFSIRDL